MPVLINVTHRKQRLSPNRNKTSRVRSELYPLLFICWEQKEIIHLVLLPQECKSATLYYEQLCLLQASITEKQPARRHPAVLQKDNARPHTATMLETVLQELGTDIFPHPAYSSDLAPLDYHVHCQTHCMADAFPTTRVAKLRERWR